MHDVGSSCIFNMWLFNFFSSKRNLKQELHGKEISGKGTKGEVDHHAFLHHQAVLHLLLISPLLLHLFSPHHHPSSPHYPSPFRLLSRLGKPPGPPSSPAGTCSTGTGISAYRHCLLLPPRFKINDRLLSIDRSHSHHKTLMFRLSSSE